MIDWIFLDIQTIETKIGINAVKGGNIMKQGKVLFLGIFSLLLMAFIAFIPMRANAAIIENGQTVVLQQYGKQFYKFTLEDDSLVQIYWARNNSKACDFNIYTDKDKAPEHYLRWVSLNSNKTGREFIAMRKGTYYVEMYEVSETPTTTVRINWTSAEKYDKGNYSAKTAQPLEADTTVRIAQVGQYSYMRWYKIKVTKAHKIELTEDYDYIYGLTVFSSDFRNLGDQYGFTMSLDGKSKTLNKKLAVGTYYICLYMYDPYAKIGGASAFKWN